MQITSDRQCQHAKTEKVQVDLPVQGVRGLYLRVSREGTKVWTLRYRVGSRQRRHKLGTYPAVGLAEAKRRALNAVSEVSGGEDPAGDRQALRAGKTFGDLFAYWYDRHAKRTLASAEFEKTRYDQHIKPHLSKLQAATLCRPDVAKMRDYVHDRSGPVQSNRCLALVNRILNFALEEDLIEANVAARMRKAGKEKPRERVLTDDEIAKLWAALAVAEAWRPAPGTGDRGRPVSLPIIRAIRLMLLTGQRRAEVIEAPSVELALGTGQPVWTLASERVKNDQPHRVPLAPLAAFEFRRAMADATSVAQRDGEFPVFPSPDDYRRSISPDAVTRAMHRLCKRIGIEPAGPHDLRRTVGTGMARLKVPPDIRSLVLNHMRGRSASETTRVYDRYGYDDEKRDAFERWEAHMRRITTGAGIAVVNMR